MASTQTIRHCTSLFRPIRKSSNRWVKLQTMTAQCSFDQVILRWSNCCNTRCFGTSRVSSYNTPFEPAKESSELIECFRLLDLVSINYARVIKQLHPELRAPICLFYLILRGLDTIEDDMTIDIKNKVPLLQNFHKNIEDVSWTYNGNGLKEKDRELLVKFNFVTKELKKIKEEYQIIIKDITKRMSKGMADAAILVHTQQGIQTMQDYQIYCHNVAGILIQGLTVMMVESKLADAAILRRPEVMESVGRYYTQINHIYDVREDFEDKRYWWPKEVWSKYVSKFSDIFLLENKEKAIQCQSEMIYISLLHAERCLSFMSELKEPSLFQFYAIPFTLAMLVLEQCFQNYSVFERSIKTKKRNSMLHPSLDFQLVCEVFRNCAQNISCKNLNRPQDPCFLGIKQACDQIEKYVESRFPTNANRDVLET